MAVNERLFDAELLVDFDIAAIERDRGQMISILERVFVENPCATVDTILDNPKKYGY